MMARILCDSILGETIMVSENDHEQKIPYSVGLQQWWPITQRSGNNGRWRGIIGINPLQNLMFREGRLLLPLIFWLVQTSGVQGHSNYTPLLNQKGGIEADNDSRAANGYFRVTSGAATRWRCRGWLRRNPKRCNSKRCNGGSR